MRAPGRALASLVACAALAVAVACSSGNGGSGGRAGGDGGRRSAPEDYCATVADVTARGGSTPAVDVSSGDAVEGLVAAFSAYADLRNAIEDLADAAPDELSDEYDTVREAFGTLPDVSDPLTALAGALFTGVNVAIAFERIDEVTSERCGVTLFALDPAAVRQITTPYVDDEGFTVLDARNLFGSAPCQIQGSVVAARSATQLVVDCGEGHYIGIDLEAYEVMWSIDKPSTIESDPGSSAQPVQFNTKADLMVTVDLDVAEAAGLTGERRDVAVTGRSLEDGEEIYHVALPRPPGTIDELRVGDGEDPSLEVVGADGTALVRMVWPMLDGMPVPMLYGVSPDGTVAWQSERLHYVFVVSQARSREFVELAAPNLPPDVISISTGESAIPPGVPALTDVDGAYSDGCSAIFTLSTMSSITVLDASTGQAHTEPVGDAGGSSTNTPSGVYYEPGGGQADSIFITPEGVTWRVGPRLATYPEVVHGRLFLTNQSGTLLEIDQATGEPLSDSAATRPPEGFVVDDGIVVAQGGLDGIRIRFEETEVICG